MSTAPEDIPKILSENLFPVVGIGASAGGLEAFKKLIKAIPENSGMAYILVQHLHPGHESALPEILQRETTIPVLEISDNVKVAPNHIYVIPANKMLVATDGVLKLSPRLIKKGLNLPIDVFFSSLAEVHQKHAIGVVLTGTGADGTMGLKDIKNHGGLTFAQDPASAAHDGMPQSAIDATVVDYIIIPENIPQKLIELQQASTIDSSKNKATKEDKITDDEFMQIVDLLLERVGVDFNFYKQTVIRRRIIQGMKKLQIRKITDFLEHLKINTAEQDILIRDISNPVNSFFRDDATFNNFCKTIFPEIVNTKSATNPLRIWVAGCSTGEEAYSIAICCNEYLSSKDYPVEVQIFATDLSAANIKKARLGFYSKKELEGLSDERIKEFFVKSEGVYQVKKQVRDSCIFAVHDFLKDPPFAKMDLISCRNVLIYLEPLLQNKAITIFHYALNKNAILWLGESETTGNAEDLFIIIKKNEKFYSRKNDIGKFASILNGNNEKKVILKNYSTIQKEITTTDVQQIADKFILANYTPAGVIINTLYDIVYFRGNTGNYLELSPGKASMNVIKMAREGLAFEIRNAINKAKLSGEPVTKENISIDEGKMNVTIEVVPLKTTLELHFLILFKETFPLTANYKEKKNKQPSQTKLADIRIKELEKELAMLRLDMHDITEEQEAVNEELQCSNEELQSGSEELQSLNEELETSKEELQSTNEELISVNHELFNKNEEINMSRRFAEVTLDVLNEPLLILDKNFVIKSANKSFYKIFKLTEDETLGKIVFELQDNGWEIPQLRIDLVRIRQEKERRLEAEIIHTFPLIGKRNICFNVQSISRENDERVILLALDDITLRKNAEEILIKNAKGILKEHGLLRNFLMDAPALFAILKGPNHVFEFANLMYAEFIGNKPLLGKSIIEVMPEIESQGYLKLLDEVYKTGKPFAAKEMPISLKSDNEKTKQSFINFNYQAITNEQGNTEGILVFAYDVTELISSRKHLKRNADMLEEMYMNVPAYVCTLMGATHIYELVNPSYQKLFGKRELLGKPIFEALPELAGQGFEEILEHVLTTGEMYLGYEVPVWLSRDEGLALEEGWFNFSYQAIYDEDNETTGILIFGYEVTEEKRGKKIQEQADKTFKMLADAMPQKMWTADKNGNVHYFNQQWFNYTQKTYEALKDRGWEKIIHPDDWNQNKKTWLNSIKSGEDFELVHRFLKSDGTYCWHLSRGVALKDTKGKVDVWIGTHTDIDEQKKKEQQKDEFIGIASHEMKTPLTTAKAYLQLLELSLDEKNETANLYAQKANQSVERLNNLITELLDVSKIQYGKLNYNYTTFSFEDMVDAAIENSQHAAPLHTIIKSGKVQLQIIGDKDRLQQVIINLLNNAVKYSPGKEKVFIDLEQQNDEIKVSVKDDGIGIASNHLDKIFDRYYRVEDHAIQFQGLGIGLFISYEIIERHLGKLWVISEEGKGSTFYFTLPVSKYSYSE